MSNSNEVFVVQGLAGARTLQGSIATSGAKNAVLKILAAAPLFKDSLTIENVPHIEDVDRSCELLLELGLTVDSKKKNTLIVHEAKKPILDMPHELSKRFRASIVFTGALLARYGKVSFPHPGGCVLGGRPIDMFLSSFEKLGATVIHKNEKYEITAPKGGLRGAHIHFRIPTVTGTETVLMAASLARGTTTITNAVLEPEVVALAEFLHDSGVKIEGIGTPTLVIHGTAQKALIAKKAYVTIPDRIEAASFVILAALAAKDVTVTHCNTIHLESVLEHLKMMGVNFTTTKNSVRVFGNEKIVLQAVTLKTHEYPGFPTDAQSPMVVALTQARGESLVWETIFEDRLRYTESLQTMGASITPMNPVQVLVRGGAKLRGKLLESPDLRAGIAFVIAGAIAKGESVIGNIYNIDRGYEYLEKRLQALGLRITREMR